MHLSTSVTSFPARAREVPQPKIAALILTFPPFRVGLMRASRRQTVIYQCESLQPTSASYQVGPPSSSTYDVSPQCHNNQLGMEMLVEPNISGASRTTTRQCVYPWQNSISNLPSRTRKFSVCTYQTSPLSVNQFTYLAAFAGTKCRAAITRSRQTPS